MIARVTLELALRKEFDYLIPPELADQIELVDVTPETLRERLQEGKVYLGDRAAAAAEGFFKDTHLTALRELALRFVAEHVDKRLRELRGAAPIKTIWRKSTSRGMTFFLKKAEIV